MTELKTIYQLQNSAGLDVLIRALTSSGYEVIGPTAQERAIVLAAITSIEDLPRGMSDEQEAGTYRLVKNENDQSFFGYNLGPHSWKAFLFPPRRRLWRLSRNENPESSLEPTKPFAFFGVRACELAAIAVQDKVLLREGGDPEYRRRREQVFMIGVHCRTAAQTCFCPSMGTGPEFTMTGLDLLITEVGSNLLIEAHTDRGLELLKMLPINPAASHERDAIHDQLAQTRKLISRTMDQADIKDVIYKSIESHNWEDVGSRCLSCANCTLVCPTCFCSTVEDVSDVDDVHAERWQKWDSCFHVDFSYVHGGSIRSSTGSRYRQWFTHKLASWHDQFGSSGCVGCGRCIAWCPVGIDLTTEMKAIRLEHEAGSKEASQ